MAAPCGHADRAAIRYARSVLVRARRGASTELWGAAIAMAVAVPAAIANGLVIYSPLGPTRAIDGVMSGLVGAAAVGIVAALFGGTRGLVSAPSAAGAAVLASAVATLLRPGAVGFAIRPEQAPMMVSAIGFGAGLVQLALGAAKGGKLIKYVPSSVIAGYLTAAGLLVLFLQIPMLLGLPPDVTPWQGLLSPRSWAPVSVAVSAVTIAVAFLAPRVTDRVPGIAVGLLAGMIAYRVLGAFDPRLLVVHGNPLLVGPLSAAVPVASPTKVLSEVATFPIRVVIAPAVTLGLLLSADTLKTCLLADALTRERHDSNRELIGQGLGNMASGLVGGAPGSGVATATVAGIRSGGLLRFSGALQGLMALGAFLLLSPVIARIPFASLAATLCVLAIGMLRRESFRLLRQRSTAMEFVVVLVVVVTALAFNLIVAAGAGVGLAMILFIREQARAPVVRRQALGNELYSKRRRVAEDLAILQQHGSRIAMFQLQGNLFFGTADQLLAVLQPHIAIREYVVLDLHRVGSFDYTAANILQHVAAELRARGGWLLLAQRAPSAPGPRVSSYVDELGESGPGNLRMFPSVYDALEWAEDRILARAKPPATGEEELRLEEMSLFAHLPVAALDVLAASVEARTFSAGEAICRKGDPGTEMLLIRKGTVRISLPLENGKRHHLETCGRGDCFGEVALLDAGTRSADAIAVTDVSLFALSRERLDQVIAAHPAVGAVLFERLARALTVRLRVSTTEVRVLREE